MVKTQSSENLALTNFVMKILLEKSVGKKSDGKKKIQKKI